MKKIRTLMEDGRLQILSYDDEKKEYALETVALDDPSLLEIALAFAKENGYKQVPGFDEKETECAWEPSFWTSERFLDALEVISHEEEITTAFVQKLLQCDYACAASTIDWLVKNDLVKEIPDSHQYKVTFLSPVQIKIDN